MSCMLRRSAAAAHRPRTVERPDDRCTRCAREVLPQPAVGRRACYHRRSTIGVGRRRGGVGQRGVDARLGAFRLLPQPLPSLALLRRRRRGRRRGRRRVEAAAELFERGYPQVGDGEQIAEGFWLHVWVCVEQHVLQWLWVGERASWRPGSVSHSLYEGPMQRLAAVRVRLDVEGRVGVAREARVPPEGHSVFELNRERFGPFSI